MARERCSYQEKAVKARLSGRKPALIFDNGIKPKHPSPFTSHHTCLLPFFSDFFFFPYHSLISHLPAPQQGSAAARGNTRAERG